MKVNFASQDGVRWTVDEYGDIPVAGVYVFLLAEIFGDHGYYGPWSERTLRSFAKRHYYDPAIVGTVVESLISNGVFDAELYARYGILTSTEIQATYVRACDKREEIVMIRDYNLLDDRDTTTRTNIVWESLPAVDSPRNSFRLSPEYPRNDTDIPPESRQFSSGFPPETPVSGPGNPLEASEKSFPDTKTPVSGHGNPQTKLNKLNNTNTITTTNNGHCPVDNLTTRMTTLLGTDVAREWLTTPRYGPDYCAAQLADMDRQRDTVRNPRTWILAALQGNYAKFQPPAPRPDPNCPHCGGRGAVTNFTNNTTTPCTCIPRPISVQQPQPPVADDPNRCDTAALVARVAAARTP